MSIADLGALTTLNVANLDVDQITFNGSGTPLTHYDEYNLTGNMAGPYAAPIAATGKLIRIGNTAMVRMNRVVGVSTTAAQMTFSTVLPILPSGTTDFPIYVQTGGTDPNITCVLGNCSVSGTGIMTICVNYTNAFPNTGNVGFPGFSMCYLTF